MPSLVLSIACSSDDGPSRPDGAAADMHEHAGDPSHSAVVVVGQSYTPDDYLTYVGVFPEVPEGDVDFGNFREFGNGNVYVNAGYVFVEQDGVMQRFSVNEALALEDGPRFSWADFGITTANASYTVFISTTRAYTFSPQLGLIVVWDPEQMVRTDAIEFDFPARPEGMETWASDGYVIGDKVVWNVFSGNWDTITPHSGLTLAIVDAHESTQPTFVEDARNGTHPKFHLTGGFLLGLERLR